jgi:hypothetical protein
MSNEPMGFEERIYRRLDSMDHKLDEVVRLSEKVAAHEKASEHMDGRVGRLEANETTTATEMSYIRGRNSVIIALLGLVGAPVTVALVLAGLAALLGVQLG